MKLTKKRVLALVMAGVMALSLCACGGGSGDYPTKGINVICPWGAGGGTDACLRAFTNAMGKDLGQTLTVDNVTGGGGITGHQAIADAEADGYTIGMITFELSTYKPLGTSDLTWESYEPLCRVNTDAATVTVATKWANDNNIKDLAGFIDYCKAHPGEVQMGGSSAASVWHIAGGYLMNATGIDIQMVTYQEGAAAAVQTIRDAINYVSGIRGDLGAVQNRLEHTGNNLSVMAENIQDAESTIRDTDVADEMMKYVKNNILVQSAQAMLAQANQVPQGVLQLLG